jgi:ubiquinone/menaquinone biosynthesis C-methylase UbiE
MAGHRVCPWWLGYLLACPLRRLWQDPTKVLGPYVGEGMTVLEPGPGMGFFTLELARRVGPSGRVVAVDIQPKMLERLKRRAAKAGVADRVDTRLAGPASMGLADLAGKVDFIAAFAVVHEMPDAPGFFAEAFQALKPGGRMLLVEPGGHVKSADFDGEIRAAAAAGLRESGRRPPVGKSHTALLEKPPASL